MFKKYVCIFLCASFLLLAACAGIVYAVDPFSHYRADKDKTKIIYQDPYYQNIGIAKYTQYDTLITGSSMVQNFRANRFDEAFGCDAVRLAFDGGYLPDFVSLLRTATTYQKDLKTVYFGLDNYLITAETALADTGAKIPAYLTDDNPFTDVAYLWNRDVLFNKIRVYFAYKRSPEYDFYEMHAWGAEARDPAVFGREIVLRTYTPQKQAEPLPRDAFLTKADETTKALCACIQQNPQVQFVFFAPPYSIVYWVKQQESGSLDATLEALRQVYTDLLQFKNVRLFFFQDEEERITDLDNYKDFSHYCADYNRWMLDCFVSGEKELPADGVDEALAHMRRVVTEYDADTLL